MYCKAESARVPETIRLFSTSVGEEGAHTPSWLIAPVSEFLLAGVERCDELLLGPSLL